MLFQSWLLTILVPLALGAPVSREPSPPTLTIMDIANATSREKLADSGKKIVLSSKTRLHGSASSDEYPALGNGGGHKSKTGTAGGISQNPGKMGLNHANKMNIFYKNGANSGGSNITRSDGGSLSLGGSEGRGTGVSSTGAVGGELDGTLGESSGGELPGSSSHGSGSSTASKSKAIGSEGITIDTTINGNDNGLGSANYTGSGATTTAQQGTIPGTGTSSASGTTVSGTNTPSPSDGITSSTSKHT